MYTYLAIFGHIWPYLAYLGAYLGAPNMVKCCRSEYYIKQRYIQVFVIAGVPVIIVFGYLLGKSSF